jgi:hypothetical protein
MRIFLLLRKKKISKFLNKNLNKNQDFGLNLDLEFNLYLNKNQDFDLNLDLEFHLDLNKKFNSSIKQFVIEKFDKNQI